MFRCPIAGSFIEKLSLFTKLSTTKPCANTSGSISPQPVDSAFSDFSSRLPSGVAMPEWSIFGRHQHTVPMIAIFLSFIY